MGEPMRVVFLAKPAMLRAYNAARDFLQSKKNINDDYITKGEIRIFNVYLV